MVYVDLFLNQNIIRYITVNKKVWDIVLKSGRVTIYVKELREKPQQWYSKLPKMKQVMQGWKSSQYFANCMFGESWTEKLSITPLESPDLSQLLLFFLEPFLAQTFFARITRVKHF